MNTAIAIQFIYPVLLSLLSFENIGAMLQTVTAPEDVPNLEKRTFIQPQLDRKPNAFMRILGDEDHTYVDKTLLLEALFLDPKLKSANIIKTMPKRFGKTVNLRMIQTFCEIEMSDDATPLAKNLSNINDTPNYHLFTQKYSFGHLKISHKKELIREYLGKYPVAYFDFLKCGSTNVNYQGVINCCQMIISLAFKKHEYLLNNNSRLTKSQRSLAESWMNADYKNKGGLEVINGIKNLMDLLYQQFKKQIIVLVDEYDLLIHRILKSKLSSEESKKIFTLYTDMFMMALKNKDARIAVFTGIIHISKFGMTEVLPRLQLCSFGQTDKFVEYYGFTLDEVTDLFKRPGNELPNFSLDAMIDYYNGYKIFGQNIFSPYSISECLEKKVIKPYWADVGSIKYIWPALRLFRLRSIVLDLYEKKNVDVEIIRKMDIDDIFELQKCMQLEQNRYGETREINVFLNFVLDAGYLTINSRNNTHYNVKAPNVETRLDLGELLDKYKLETA